MINTKAERAPRLKSFACALAGVVHLLVPRRESWTSGDVGEDVIVVDQPAHDSRQPNDPGAGRRAASELWTELEGL